MNLKKIRVFALVCALAVISTVALMPLRPVAAQGRALPDFTDLVEQVGPSVVNIRMLEKSRAASAGSGTDEEMQEFFRRFFGAPIPPRQQQPAPRGRKP
ncbi:MAG: serine peptidase, partial [Burkholderiaceae bacterium]|nr:serine peptidase [Burkholderiaceae bacterium]